MKHADLLAAMTVAFHEEWDLHTRTEDQLRAALRVFIKEAGLDMRDEVAFRGNALDSCIILAEMAEGGTDV